MKRLYGTADPAEAEAIRILLRDLGIDATLERAEGEGPISINVRDEDAGIAAEALAEHFERQDPRGAPVQGPEEPRAGFWPGLLRMLGFGAKRKEPAP